jgi:hypothetical protein
LVVTDSASHAIALECCHLKSHIDSDLVDDFPSAPYPVLHASQVLPVFQDGRPVHSLRVAHRGIRVPGSVGNYLGQLAQNARNASLLQPVVPSSSDNGASDWSFQPPSASGSSRLSNGFSDLDSDFSLPADWEKHPLLQSTQGTTQQEASQTPVSQDLNLDNLLYDDDDQLDVSDSVEYDWQFSGHRFIGERISKIIMV